MADITVFEAFSNVMGSVQGIRKGDRNNQQGFDFRGIDAVLNAVGPALREHRVVIVPTAESIDIERYQTAKGGQMQGVIVRMTYTVYGPGGDSFAGSAYGQAADAGDKAVSKAQSVAYRTFLLQGLTVPTDEPDPDSAVHERAVETRNPLREAKNDLAAAVRDAGMDLNEFASWALSAKGPGLNIRECTDVRKLDDLTRRVEHEGATILGPAHEAEQQTLTEGAS